MVRIGKGRKGTEGGGGQGETGALTCADAIGD